jgi:ABC-2 type transport system permease protein
MRRFWPMVRKEFIQMRRDRLTLGIMFGIPVVQLLMFGYAIQTDVRHIPTVVVDESRTPESRSIIQALENTGNFRIVAYADDRGTLDDAIARGRAQAGIVVPYDYARNLGRGSTASFQVIVDASDPLSSQSALAAAAGVAQVRNLELLAALAGRSTLPLETRVRPRYNPGLRSPTYIVPGLVGLILTMTMVLITAVAIVRERERGNLELLINTPVRTPELMVGKILPYMVIGLIQTTLILLVGRLLFDVPIRGSLADVYVAGFVFVTASLTLGLLISTFAATQVQAFQITFFTFLPQILLSGFMFPFDGMPRFAQELGELLPLTHFIRLVRGILLRGAGLGGLLPDVWPLLAFFFLTVTLAILKFHKRLD